MMNTSAIKQQQDLISILTTQLEKEKARLKELQSVETKISKTLETLLPILAEYPEYKKAIAEPLGLTLPTPPKLKVIEITDSEETNNNQTIEKPYTLPQPESNPTPTITIKEIITELTSTFPQGWKYNETESTWEMALTETEVTRITQNTNTPTGTIELKERLYQWNLHETSGDIPIIILTLQEENNNDTTSDNNAETDSTHIEKYGDVPTPPTSDTTKQVTWYDSSSGEVILDNEHRYFKVFYDVKEDDYEIRLKKSETAKKWSKNTNSTTQKFIDAVWKNTKNNPSNKENGGLKQELHNAATEIGGKFCQYPSDNITSFGFFYIKDQKIAEVGYQNNSWWFIAPGKNQVYCDGDAATFTQVLKGLATEESPYSNEEEIDKIATAFDTRIENVNESNSSQTSSKSSDCWYTPPQIVELIEEVLGKIDLDPCADDKKHIPAKYHKTIREDGLACVWHGKVFLNPPYSCPAKWIEKLISEIDSGNVTEAIALLPASTDTKWFKPLWNQPICFWKGRIKFLDANYEPSSPARQSHCFIYWGDRVDKFNEIFSEFGEVILPKEDLQIVEIEPLEVEKTLTLTEKITPLLLENWVIETVGDSQVLIYSSDNKNSDWVKITELHNYSNTPFIISHGTEFSNNAKDIKSALERAKWWFESTDKTDYLEIFIKIINSYKTDLTLQRKDSSTAYIQISQETLGTIFYKDDKTLEIAEREKQIFIESYSIDLDKLIQDINNQDIQAIDEELINSYLMVRGSKDAEFNPLDTLQNALHCLSNQLNLVTIRQGKTFKVYNGKGWLENYLGSVKVNDYEIISDEELIYELLNNHSILLNQLTTDIVKGKTEIETDNYVITSETLKELLTKENWDNWNEQDFDTAHNLLNELVEFSPAWNQLIETIRQQRQALIEQTTENDDDNPSDNGGLPTPPSTPNNPNNNGVNEVELTTENLDSLETAVNSYKTDLKLEKSEAKLTFNQGKSQLGSVTINSDKLLAEPRLISHLKVFYGIDIKGLIKSIEYVSIDNCFELDPFEHIGSNNNAFKPLGCVVAPTWKGGHERRGILNSVSGELATIQWLDGEPGIEQVNINLLRYISYPPLSNLDSSRVSTVSSYSVNTDNPTEYDSDEPTAETISSLNFGGLIAATTISNTDTNKEENNSIQGNENHTTTELDNIEVIEDTASDFFDDWDAPTSMDLIKASIEFLEGFKVRHDEVDLTVTHYGTDVGSIHHNEEYKLEIEQKLIGELAKYDFDLEAFLVAENIPYQLYHPKPVVTDTQTSEHTKKSHPGSSNGSKTGSNVLNDDADTTNTKNSPVDLLDKLAAVFDSFDNIRTKRSGTTLWFYRGDDNLYPCLMETRDGNTFTLFPTVKLKSHMKELFGIDVDQVCDNLEAGKSIDINDYVEQSIWQKTIKDFITSNKTINISDTLNTTDSKTSISQNPVEELNASTTTEESNAESHEHPEGLHWIKDTSMYNRSETYVVWNGTQKCGKIHICNKSKNKAGFGKWYVSPNVFGPYYDTISEAAQACWQQLTESSRAIELELVPK